ncbi:MAG: hypothetical protein FWG70_06365 [Oscillospiraceae bacterium]|nr:hypothetical protein [Oscillospiraceae bacterium]
MLSEKQFEGLKKVNLSVDPQKSKDRIAADFKSATGEIKKKALELSGLSRATFYNAFQKGTASPKMVLALAQLLGVSPYYYTGESDSKGEFDDSVLKSFLEDKKLVTPAKKGGRPKSKTESTPVGKTAKATAKSASAEKTAAKPGRKSAAKEPAKAAPKTKATKAAPKAKAVKAAPKAKAVKAAPKAKAVKAAPKAKAVKAAPKAKAVKAAPKTKAVKAAPKTTAPKAVMPKAAKANDEVFIQVSIPKSLKLQRAVANLDEESAVILLRGLLRKAEANDQAKALCDIIKSCLLS